MILRLGLAKKSEKSKENYWKGFQKSHGTGTELKVEKLQYMNVSHD